MDLQGRKRKRLCTAGVLLGLLAIVLVWGWRPGGGENADSSLWPASSYQNARPGVKYVGDDACVGCHIQRAAGYREHPMSRSLALVSAAAPIERYQAAASNPFLSAGLHFAVDRQPQGIFHREWAADARGKVLAEMKTEVHLAVGSGTRGRAYLVNHDGYLFQSPITWYPQARPEKGLANKGKWDLSPGYEAHQQHFSRPINPGCLFCHCNQAEHVPGTVNRYRPPVFQGHGIGCERCHGPGELHLKRRQGKSETSPGPDDTIVNPALLEPVLREAVCQQCHLQAEQRILPRGRSYFDYRPGLPLHPFLMDFVVEGKGEETKFVSQVEQMFASRCYQASQGEDKLGCISCHDPHRFPAPEAKAAYYRSRCLHCHGQKSCTGPETDRRPKGDNCVACHMPPTGSDIRHTSITDHRVPRRASGLPPGPRSFPNPEGLVAFNHGVLPMNEAEVSRSLGVALIEMLGGQPPPAVARHIAGKALPLLERALEQHPDDPLGLLQKGTALWTLGHRDRAMTAYEKALALKPEWETAISGAGNLALALNRLEAARSYLERALRVNPWRWQYHHQLAAVFFADGDWERAVQACRDSLQLEPAGTISRTLLVKCLLRSGRNKQAAGEFETLLQLTPETRRPDLQRWFQELSAGEVTPRSPG